MFRSMDEERETITVQDWLAGTNQAMRKTNLTPGIQVLGDTILQSRIHLKDEGAIMT